MIKFRCMKKVVKNKDWSNKQNNKPLIRVKIVTPNQQIKQIQLTN